jgi:broad specificity phosphatase PhoE
VAEKSGFRYVHDFTSQTDQHPDGTPAVLSLYVLDLAPGVLLVRHAMPAARADIAARDWPLSAEGLAAARRLRLPTGASLVASDEPKAAQTLRAACPGAEILADAGFGEVRRPGEWDGDHRARARAYVEGARHAGWEPQEQVVARFEAAIARHATPGRLLIVGTHGMALTLWLALRDPGPFWAALRFPDLIDPRLAQTSAPTMTEARHAQTRAGGAPTMTEAP